MNKEKVLEDLKVYRENRVYKEYRVNRVSKVHKENRVYKVYREKLELLDRMDIVQ
jgi:hypothetical protein